MLFLTLWPNCRVRLMTNTLTSFHPQVRGPVRSRPAPWSYSTSNSLSVFVLCQDSVGLRPVRVLYQTRSGCNNVRGTAWTCDVWFPSVSCTPAGRQPVQSERLRLQVLAFLTVEMSVLRGNIYFLNLIYFCHFNEPHSSTLSENIQEVGADLSRCVSG